MLYELRTYTLKPGGVGNMIKAGSTVEHEIRKDSHGKLEGYWFTDIGPLNQVMHLWMLHRFRRTRATSRSARQEPALGW